jgi:hypothetical protein
MPALESIEATSSLSRPATVKDITAVCNSGSGL